MTLTTHASRPQGRPPLLGQTVVVIGGSSGIGLESARQAQAAGAGVILTGRSPQRLRDAALELHALDTAAFDATDPDRLEQFFHALASPVDHVMVTAGGPHYMPLADMDLAEARRAFDQRVSMVLGVALYSRGRVRPGGSLLFVGGTGGRRAGVGLAIVSTLTAALPALTANLALELAPTRVNLIAPGFAIRHCRRHSSAITSRTGARSCAPRCPSAAWSGPPTSPPSPAPHGQRSSHRRDLRHRRWPAAHLPVTSCPARSLRAGTPKPRA